MALFRFISFLPFFLLLIFRNDTIWGFKPFNTTIYSVYHFFFFAGIDLDRVCRSSCEYFIDDLNSYMKKKQLTIECHEKRVRRRSREREKKRLREWHIEKEEVEKAADQTKPNITKRNTNARAHAHFQWVEHISLLFDLTLLLICSSSFSKDIQVDQMFSGQWCTLRSIWLQFFRWSFLYFILLYSSSHTYSHTPHEMWFVVNRLIEIWEKKIVDRIIKGHFNSIDVNGNEWYIYAWFVCVCACVYVCECERDCGCACICLSIGNNQKAYKMYVKMNERKNANTK